jgi:hypothetical protein
LRAAIEYRRVAVVQELLRDPRSSKIIAEEFLRFATQVYGNSRVVSALLADGRVEIKSPAILINAVTIVTNTNILLILKIRETPEWLKSCWNLEESILLLLLERPTC